MRTFTICLFLIFCVSSGYAQSKIAFVENPFDVFKKGANKKQIVKTTDKTLGFSIKTDAGSYHSLQPSINVLFNRSFLLTILPVNLVVQNFGTVCKMELKMQKQIKLPLYIRMGNKEYVDKMEGKRL